MFGEEEGRDVARARGRIALVKEGILYVGGKFSVHAKNIVH